MCPQGDMGPSTSDTNYISTTPPCDKEMLTVVVGEGRRKIKKSIFKD
jgi:hypothetical protein